MKLLEVIFLWFGVQLFVLDECKIFFEMNIGFVLKCYLCFFDWLFLDLVIIVQLYFGVFYLWGGNMMLGIDCFGFVQVVLMVCDIFCFGDSDMQCVEVIGIDIMWFDIMCGDLVFWDGYVVMVVDD